MRTSIFEVLATVLVVGCFLSTWTPESGVIRFLRDQKRHVRSRIDALTEAKETCSRSGAASILAADPSELEELPCNYERLTAMQYEDWYHASMAQMGGFEPYMSIVNISSLDEKIKMGQPFSSHLIDWHYDSQRKLFASITPSDFPTQRGAAGAPLVAADTIPPPPEDPSDPFEWVRRRVPMLPTLPFHPVDYAAFLALMRAYNTSTVLDIGGGLPPQLIERICTATSAEYALAHPRVGMPPNPRLFALDDEGLEERRTAMKSCANGTTLGPKDFMRQRAIDRYHNKLSTADLLRGMWWRRSTPPVKIEPGDIVVLRTSRVGRLDSEGMYFLLEILPTLPGGVIVYFHGVWAPKHYPKDLYAKYRWFANEQYLLAACLSGTPRYKVVLGLQGLLMEHPDLPLNTFGKDADAALRKLEETDPVSSPSGFFVQIQGSAPGTYHEPGFDPDA